MARSAHDDAEPYDDTQHDTYSDWLVDRAVRALEAASGGTINREALRMQFDFGPLAGAEGAPDTGGAAVRSIAGPELVSDITGAIDAGDLLALDLPPLRFVVDDLIAEGTTILAASPKAGKSWLMYQMAVEGALGGELLGRKVNRCKVLYLALEDGKRRGQGRLRTTLRGRKPPARGWLTVQWKVDPLGGGFEEFVQEWLDANVDTAAGELALIVVDTLGRVRGEQAGDTRRNAYSVDVRDLGRIQQFTQERQGVALVIVHHTNKGRDDDFVARVSGTYGIAGSADTILELRRKRTEAVGILAITSRELPEIEIPVRLDVDEHGGWVLAPDALPGASWERKAIYEAIRNAPEPVMAGAVAKDLEMVRSTVQHLIRSMEEDGLVMRTKGGYVAVDRVSDGQVH